MQRRIETSFRNGSLVPTSELKELRHIGEYLYDRLVREFAPQNRTLSIRGFARKIQHLNSSVLKHRLQSALQNRRNNQCVRTPGRLPYHVPDFNIKGYEVMISLIKVLDHNRDGYGLGRNFAFASADLRMPRRRHDDAKTVACLSRASCRQHGGIWRDGMCQPSVRSTGFAGVHPFSGQKVARRRAASPLGSVHNSIRRGRYASTGGQMQWRRPGPMQKI